MGVGCRCRGDAVGQDRGAIDLGEVDVGHQHVAVGRCTADRRAGGEQVGRPGDEGDLAAVAADRRLRGAEVAADDLRAEAGRHAADEHDRAVELGCSGRSAAGSC